MMKFKYCRYITLLSLNFAFLTAQAQEKKVPTKDVSAFQIYTSNGKKLSYEKFVNQLVKAQSNKSLESNVILFGELHDNPIAHWLELQLTQDIYERNSKMVLGAEMFETDQQFAVNEYLNPSKDTASKKSVTPMGMMTGQDPAYSKLKKSVKLWNNFATDYQPLLDFSKDNHLPFVATNIPRRYASLVYRKGIAALYASAENYVSQAGNANSVINFSQKINPTCDTGILSNAYLNELYPSSFFYDSTLKCYRDIFNMAGGHGGQNLPMSQAIKDATMAKNIYTHLLNQGGVYMHYNGSYHSDNHQSIEWYLKMYLDFRERKDIDTINIKTISTRTQSNVSQLDKENFGIADYIIVVPENMTRTYK